MTQFYSDPAGYTDVTKCIINEILACKNMSNELENLQIQLDVTQRLVAQTNLRLDMVLARGGNRKVGRLETGSQFPDVPVFDGKHPKELRSWILHPRNKLGTQSTIHANLVAQGRYTFK